MPSRCLSLFSCSAVWQSCSGASLSAIAVPRAPRVSFVLASVRASALCSRPGRNLPAKQHTEAYSNGCFRVVFCFLGPVLTCVLRFSRAVSHCALQDNLDLTITTAHSTILCVLSSLLFLLCGRLCSLLVLCFLGVVAEIFSL